MRAVADLMGPRGITTVVDAVHRPYLICPWSRGEVTA
ncbi:MAG: hypothetical protein JWN32_1903 [Solirubrobacterales bacterium]|nr:hypothetical protein [Solirubrobacterales bacterium]